MNGAIGLIVRAVDAAFVIGGWELGKFARESVVLRKETGILRFRCSNASTRQRLINKFREDGWQ